MMEQNSSLCGARSKALIALVDNPGEEAAAQRMLLPAGCCHDGCDRRSRPVPQHCNNLGVLDASARFGECARSSTNGQRPLWSWLFTRE
jgi:hypothetical protein